jgi:hypothetical protein
LLLVTDESAMQILQHISKLKMIVFWCVAPYSLKRRSVSIRLHSANPRRVIFILVAMRTWNLTCPNHSQLFSYTQHRQASAVVPPCHHTHVWLHSPVDSILDAVLTVSPNKQYRGIVRPTTPAQHGPVDNTGVHTFRNTALASLAKRSQNSWEINTYDVSLFTLVYLCATRFGAVTVYTGGDVSWNGRFGATGPVPLSLSDQRDPEFELEALPPPYMHPLLFRPKNTEI